MTIVRCSQKLLKRLRLPPALTEPVPADNPLGEWCADIFAADLLRARLLPSTKIIPLHAAHDPH